MCLIMFAYTSLATLRIVELTLQAISAGLLPIGKTSPPHRMLKIVARLIRPRRPGGVSEFLVVGELWFCLNCLFQFFTQCDLSSDGRLIRLR